MFKITSLKKMDGFLKYTQWRIIYENSYQICLEINIYTHVNKEVCYRKYMKFEYYTEWKRLLQVSISGCPRSNIEFG